jgi:hypothetical protein
LQDSANKGAARLWSCVRNRRAAWFSAPPAGSACHRRRGSPCREPGQRQFTPNQTSEGSPVSSTDDQKAALRAACHGARKIGHFWARPAAPPPFSSRRRFSNAYAYAARTPLWLAIRRCRPLPDCRKALSVPETPPTAFGPWGLSGILCHWVARPERPWRNTAKLPCQSALTQEILRSRPWLFAC